MQQKINKNEPSRKRCLLLTDDFKSSANALSSRKDILIIDTIPGLNLITIETFQSELDELKKKRGYHIFDENVLTKIEPALLYKLKIKVNEHENNISILIDLEPFNNENITHIEGMEGVVIQKKYPFLSSIYISSPAKILLELANQKYVKKISDSKGDIRPTMV